MIMKTLTLLLLSGATLWAQAPNRETGKALFESKACYQCHGYRGQGGLNGPRLAQTKLTLDGFRAILRNPPVGDMPQYRATLLSDKDVADIFADEPFFGDETDETVTEPEPETEAKTQGTLAD